MSIKTFLLGQPIATEREVHERISKRVGLAVFSSDNLSSVAYATDEILLALILAGPAALHFSLPIATAITVLFAVIALSYWQTIHAYPQGGGAYIVAKDNIGEKTALVAAAALLVDYVLTVTVSITAGIEAITSAFPALKMYSITLCIISLAVVMMVNLRGVRESGTIFAVPTYLFIAAMLLLIGVGVAQAAMQPQAAVLEFESTFEGGLGVVPLILLFRAFASGCAAITGIEAVANGVRAFRVPEARNAAVTLMVMAAILGSMFMGTTFLAFHHHIQPKDGETVLSQLGHIVFSSGALYYFLQVTTFLILILAANTAFADFPRLSSVLARDYFMPRQLLSQGDKLVYSNGILLLGLFAGLLIVMSGGSTHAMIPLYAVGVFTAITISQAGMVMHWLRRKEAGWLRGALLNGVGAAATLVVLMVVGITKFSHGAWLVVITIPTLMYLMMRIRVHYRLLADQLLPDASDVSTPFTHHTVIVPVSGVQKATVQALRYARTLSDDVVALYVSLDDNKPSVTKQKWDQYAKDVPLIVLDSPFRSVVWPIIDYVDEVRAMHKDGIITVVLPEFIPSRWWHHLLHNQTALVIKGMLLFRRGVVSTSVPMPLK